MSIRYSKSTLSLKTSEIREILKLTEQPDLISFAGGLPAPELFPLDKIIEINKEVLETSGRAALQYSITEGYKPLREIIAKERMGNANVKTFSDNILITNGSQQGLEFSARLFIDKGDIIICESPSYLGAINAFDAYGPKYIEIPMDEDGMIIEGLERALEEHPEAKMIYTIPDFQNPSGKTLSVKRRKQMVKLSEKYNIPIIEDNPYGDLIFEGKRLPAIKSFDTTGHVIFLGTFSKTFCPGIRIGWVCADKEILNKYIMIKQITDLQSSTVNQMELAAFMEKYNLDEHIDEIIKVYKNRRDLMLDSMKKYFPKEVEFTKPKGGLFTWVELKEDMDSVSIFKEAVAEKVAFVPGISFFPNKDHHNFFRLNYSNMEETKIIEGIKRLGKVLYKHYN
ncbi:MAG: PLP-dependent aminotransferase family protein [Clostridiaceae bacterium]